MSAGVLPLDQRRLGEVLAALRQRKLGLLGPGRLESVEAVDGPAQLLDVGDRAGGRGAYLDQSLFHLEDDHPDHPRRVFGPVEKVGHVGGEDVTGAAEHRAAEPGSDRSQPRGGGRLRSFHQPRDADRDLGFENFELRH